jgi:hypothetical protein
MTAPRDCTTCAFANWQRTAAGKLHPSGDGRCTWKMPGVAISKAFYWIGFGGGDSMPTPSGGHISRRSPHADCPTYDPL